MNGYQSITPSILSEIEAAVGADAVVRDRKTLETYSRDATDVVCMPEVAVEADRVDQVQALLRLANKRHFPVTPRGGGSGLSGGALPVEGGVVLSLARMNSIRINERNLTAEVGPGAITKAIKDEARAKGLFYPPDPAGFELSTIGGNAAHNSGGPACLKYGVTRHYILALEAVLPTGEVIRAGSATRKGVVGYNLANLLVGSEGTLGVITGLTLKLIPHPEAVTTLVAIFPDMPKAMRGVNAILTSGHLPSAIEFLDHRCLGLIGDLLPFSGFGAASSLLLIEADGPKEQIEREIEEIGRICQSSGASHLLPAPDEKSREQVWEVRRQVSLRIHDSAGLYMPEDVAVPLDRIDALVARLPEFESRYDATVYAFGHAGDGNIHLNFTAPGIEAHDRVAQCIREILSLVVSMGGTISGEHGIGIAKRPYIGLELSAESIRLQRAIKEVFDPGLILNPGKIF